MDISTRNSHLRQLRDQLIDGILSSVNGSWLTGHPNLRLPNHASFVFSGIDGNQLIRILDANGFCCSSGSACKVGSPSPSNVLLETGYSRDLALSSLRVTLGKENSLEQVNELIKIIDKTVTTLRK
jgi:cysteine desulfurase